MPARFGAVRNVFTPGHGSRVEHLDELQTGGVYVAAGRERFKKIDYAQIDAKGSKPRGKNGCLETLRANALRGSEERRVTVSLSRIRHLVPEPLIIYVFVNGESGQAPVRVIVPRRVLASWERVLELVSQRVTLRSGIVRRLYSLEGLPLAHGSELQSGHGYVALGREPFQTRRYGPLASSTRQPHGRRLPPLQKQPAEKPKRALGNHDSEAQVQAMNSVRERLRMAVRQSSSLARLSRGNTLSSLVSLTMDNMPKSTDRSEVGSPELSSPGDPLAGDAAHGGDDDAGEERPSPAGSRERDESTGAEAPSERASAAPEELGDHEEEDEEDEKVVGEKEEVEEVKEEEAGEEKEAGEEEPPSVELPVADEEEKEEQEEEKEEEEGEEEEETTGERNSDSEPPETTVEPPTPQPDADKEEETVTEEVEKM
ncbi:uncharacterized protein LOC142906371 [Petromyzon marinus]|uniref:uncharacterized protein LOC142906371 n=1 Tax=Petromyzon marinus TaxID=7757 RepID=UPI003F7219C6